ncbi:MAG: alpha/beta fold hydrolase [gamma proteobacterium endosymbiont of Lamellibrachia anaximandri]|nr:alpha/beta fold hydrolase [gamma proteobacterium endosymbiont of Lamellibrachia anaximandri]MBL3617440.1 alpha/beta fold hydrolase [gamma proteobacterium endosymbiont of Lamellibrachia anaximandri]
MSAFIFGDGQRPLYGVHHTPTSGRHRDAAVLICHSLGREYMRTHRGLVRLAEQLAREGFHVLRFDYFSTGDSSGDDGEGSLEQWVEDVKVAAQELKDLAGLDKVSLVGVRIGAALATLAAVEMAVEGLILWDPVVSGAAYVDFQIGFSRSYYADLDRFPVSRLQAIDAGADDLMGYRWPQSLRDSLGNCDLMRLKKVRARQAEVISSDERLEYRELQAHLTRIEVPTTYHAVEEQTGWESLEKLGEAMMMHGVSKRILAKLAAR